jgi:hypothetical protein
MYICTNCLSLNTSISKISISCKDCDYKQTIKNYKSKLRVAKDTVRYGFQYRKRQEYELKKNPNSSKQYSLVDLHEIFNTVGLVVLEGIAVNFAYDILKSNIKKILKNPLVIEIDDKDFKRFLKSDAQQEKFIKYIEEYRKKKIEIVKSKKRKSPKRRKKK